MKKNKLLKVLSLSALIGIGVSSLTSCNSNESSVDSSSVIVTPNIENGVSLTSYSTSTSDVDITATITPSDATNQTLDWSAAWTDSSVTDTLSDYITTSISSDTLTCSVTLSTFFTNQITITCTSESDSSVTATTTLDTAGRITSDGNYSSIYNTINNSSTSYSLFGAYDYDEYSYDTIDSADYLTDYYGNNSFVDGLIDFDFGFSNTDYLDDSVEITGDTLELDDWDLNSSTCFDIDQDSTGVSLLSSGFESLLEDEIYSQIGSLNDDTTISIDDVALVCSDTFSSSCSSAGLSFSDGSYDYGFSLFGQKSLMNDFSYGTGIEYDDWADNTDLYDLFSDYSSSDNLFDLVVTGETTYDSSTVQSFTIDYPVTGIYYSEILVDSISNSDSSLVF